MGIGKFEDRNNKDLSNRSSPVQVIGVGNNWKSVPCGYKHTMAVQYIFQNAFIPKKVLVKEYLMFIIVKNNNVVLGPTNWNQNIFERCLKNEFKVDIELPLTLIKKIN